MRMGRTREGFGSRDSLTTFETNPDKAGSERLPTSDSAADRYAVLPKGGRHVANRLGTFQCAPRTKVANSGLTCHVIVLGY